MAGGPHEGKRKATTSEYGGTLKRSIIILFGIILATAGFAGPKESKSEGLSFEELRIWHEQTIEKKRQDELAKSQELTAKAEALRGKRLGQCVLAVRYFLGVGRSEIQGAAKTTRINSSEPKVGSIIVLRMSRYGHVGVVLQTVGDQVIYFDSNGDWSGRGAIRSININDNRIRGYRVVNNVKTI